jgi:hypothetical protein
MRRVITAEESGTSKPFVTERNEANHQQPHHPVEIIADRYDKYNGNNPEKGTVIRRINDENTTQWDRFNSFNRTKNRRTLGCTISRP